MIKEKIKAIINLLSIILFLATILTILILMIFFAPMNGIGYRVFLSIPKKEWLIIHQWIGLSFVIIAIINFFLNFKKFISQAKSVFKRKK